MPKTSYLWRQGVFINNPKYLITEIEADGYIRDGGDLPLGSLTMGKKEAEHAFRRILGGEYHERAVLHIKVRGGNGLKAVLEHGKVRFENG